MSGEQAKYSSVHWFHTADPATARMDFYWARASTLYQQDGTLSHERVASELTRFILARLDDGGRSPERDAVADIVGSAGRMANYFSNGEKQIRAALATLLRVAAAYVGHPDYREEWRP